MTCASKAAFFISFKTFENATTRYLFDFTCLTNLIRREKFGQIPGFHIGQIPLIETPVFQDHVQGLRIQS